MIGGIQRTQRSIFRRWRHRIACALGYHREVIEARWGSEGLDTIYGVTCQFCRRSRCTIAGEKPLPPPAPNTRHMGLYKAQHQAAKRWLEGQLGRPVTERFVWWR